MISSKSLMSPRTSGNSKWDPEELDPDSQVQSNFVLSWPKVSISNSAGCSLLLLFIPKKSVMDSRSAKWVISVWGRVSEVRVFISLILQPPNRKLAVSGSMTGWGWGCVWPALLDSKKLVTTSGKDWRMTSGGVLTVCWFTTGVGTDGVCTNPLLFELAWLTIIEVKSALLVGAGSTWAEIIEKCRLIFVIRS